MAYNKIFEGADIEKAIAIIVKLLEEQEGVKITYELVRKDELGKTEST